MQLRLVSVFACLGQLVLGYQDPKGFIRSSMQISGEGNVQASPSLAQSEAATYGFYIHAFTNPAAVIYQVRKLKEYMPHSPVYIMSDGGDSFEELCKQEGCQFVHCPPANDRWHPWPFMKRLHDAGIALKTEFVIMLEPDNTIHGPITRKPEHDAGGLRVKDRRYGAREYAESLAHKTKPDFHWTDEMMHTGLCGGTYFRTTALLDAFSDESVASIDWNYLAQNVTKNVFSSDFAMPYLLAAKGYAVYPWEDSAQYSDVKDVIVEGSGAPDAAFRHYGRGYPGGKPTYNMVVQPEDKSLFTSPPKEYVKFNSVCQMCYSLDSYVKHWGSNRCTNKHAFEYSPWIKERFGSHVMLIEEGEVL